MTNTQASGCHQHVTVAPAGGGARFTYFIHTLTKGTPDKSAGRGKKLFSLWTFLLFFDFW